MKSSTHKGYILWITWRHIMAKKGRSLSFMTWVSILGVAIGVAALVIVLSIMGGLAQDLKQRMFRGLPHLEIFNAENAMYGFSLDTLNPGNVRQLLGNRVSGVAAFTRADVVIRHHKHLASVTLFGVDPLADTNLWAFSDHLIEGKLSDLLADHGQNEGSDSLPGIILGESLALQMGLETGDILQVLNPQIRMADALGGQRFSNNFRVRGIFMTDLPQYDSNYGVVSLLSGRKFLPDYDKSLDDEQYVTGIAADLKDPESVDDALSLLEPLENIQIRSWKVVNRSLLIALRLEKFTMASILLLIVLVAAFSISGTMMMTVYHRKHQVALLRSLGMNRKDVIAMFLAHGLSIGSLGVFLGLGTGLAACSLLYYFQFINLPAHIYYLQKLPVRFLPLEYVVICLCAWLLSLVAAVYPALTASRQDPGGGLRCL